MAPATLALGTIRATHAGAPLTYDVAVDQPGPGTLYRGVEAAATPGVAYAVGDRVVVAGIAGTMVVVGRLVTDLRALGSTCKAKHTNCNISAVVVGWSGALSFATAEFDGNANMVAGVYTCPLTGYYRVTASLTASTAASGIFECVLFKNSVEYHMGSTEMLNGGDWVTSQLATTVKAVAGDVIDLRCYQSSPGVLALVASSPLSHIAVAFDSQ